MFFFCVKMGIMILLLLVFLKNGEKRSGNGVGWKGGGRERNMYKFVRVWVWYMDEDEGKE